MLDSHLGTNLMWTKEKSFRIHIFIKKELTSDVKRKGKKVE